MTHKLQQLLLALYGLASRSGALSSRPGRALFRFAYWRYKRHLEAPGLGALRPFVRPGSWVVDVGANIGFATTMFAEWVERGGKVLALEPDRENFSELAHVLSKRRLQDRVVARAVGAWRRTGTGRLARDPVHPGNHRITADEGGDPVNLVRLDDLLAELGHPEVSLLKVDVQGGELDVLAGATGLLESQRPVLLLEFDPEAMLGFGATPGRLIATLRDHAYVPFNASGRSLRGPIAWEQIERMDEGYVDLALFPEGTELPAAAAISA